MSAQASLPLVGVTRCGYCYSRLTLQDGGDWACTRCRPGLAEVRTPEQWASFQRKTALDPATKKRIADFARECNVNAGFALPEKQKTRTRRASDATSAGGGE